MNYGAVRLTRFVRAAAMPYRHRHSKPQLPTNDLPPPADTLNTLETTDAHPMAWIGIAQPSNARS